MRAWSEVERQFYEVELPKVLADQPAIPYRSWLGSRQARAFLGAAARMAGLWAAVLPVVFAVGWLYEAGRLTGYGVPLSLMQPDPGQLISAAVLIVAGIAVTLGLVSALLLAALRIGYRWRAVLMAALLPIALLVVPLYISGRLNDTLFNLFALGVLVFVSAPFMARAFPRREVALLAFAMAFAIPFPLGWSTARTEAASPNRNGAVTITVGAPLAGLDGRTVATGCAYTDVLLVRADAASVVFRRPSNGGVWVVPSGNVVAITLGSPEFHGSDC
jgi:hypothetical protein